MVVQATCQSHCSCPAGEAASKLRRDSLNQLVLQQVLLAQLDTSATYSAEDQLHQAVCQAAGDCGGV